jgi:3'-phosphoadenosine 5'-phosphosulfate sulfotransferase (PAPS reductase)/FAD synthetase
MKDLLDNTIERVLRWHKRWPKSVVLWSGGKDSTVLLHLIRYVCKIDLPVVQYREPKLRERYAYSDNLINQWDLEVYDYPPSKITITDGPDVETGEPRFDFLKYQQWGNKCVIVAQGTERPKVGERYLCAVDDYFKRPLGYFSWPWEAAFIGTKSSDIDSIKGSIPLSMDVRYAEGSPVSLYPLRFWTDEDIFGYLEEYKITPDPNRYVYRDGKWGNNPDKSLNSDYFPVCVNCVDRRGPKHVYCPKLNATISNISPSAPYEDVVFDDLGIRPVQWSEKQLQEK